LLPWLIRLSHNPDPDVRMSAYVAAFFVQPPEDVFLPLADRAMRDTAAGCGQAAAQWMTQRFPEQARKRGLPVRSTELIDPAPGSTESRE
jgi:hypothetical protein